MSIQLFDLIDSIHKNFEIIKYKQTQFLELGKQLNMQYKRDANLFLAKIKTKK